jgi:hypothetical protein
VLQIGTVVKKRLSKRKASGSSPRCGDFVTGVNVMFGVTLGDVFMLCFTLMMLYLYSTGST